LPRLLSSATFHAAIVISAIGRSRDDRRMGYNPAMIAGQAGSTAGAGGTGLIDCVNMYGQNLSLAMHARFT